MEKAMAITRNRILIFLLFVCVVFTRFAPHSVTAQTALQIRSALEAITVETLTPIEAMNELYKLKKMLN